MNPRRLSPHQPNDPKHPHPDPALFPKVSPVQKSSVITHGEILTLTIYN